MLRPVGRIWASSAVHQASPSSWHWPKSMGSPQSSHVCDLLNSSEKISFGAPHCGHLQMNDLRCLKFSKPGQCCGVVMTSSIKAGVLPPAFSSQSLFGIVSRGLTIKQAHTHGGILASQHQPMGQRVDTSYLMRGSLPPLTQSGV